MNTTASRRLFLSAASAVAVGATLRVGQDSLADDGGCPATVPLPPLPTHGLLFSCKYGMTKGASLEARLAAAGLDRAREEIGRVLPLAASLGQRVLFENVWNGLFYDPAGPRTQSARGFADYIDSFKSPWVGAFFDLGNHARYGDVASWVRELGPRIVKLDIKGYSNKKADIEGPWKGFVDITAGDIDWASVRAALRDIGFAGWVSAEVGGGDVERLKVVLDQMKTALLG
jgi:sugar phosphate isomerase/epimerase